MHANLEPTKLNSAQFLDFFLVVLIYKTLWHHELWLLQTSMENLLYHLSLMFVQYQHLHDKHVFFLIVCLHLSHCFCKKFVRYKIIIFQKLYQVDIKLTMWFSVANNILHKYVVANTIVLRFCPLQHLVPQKNILKLDGFSYLFLK